MTSALWFAAGFVTCLAMCTVVALVLLVGAAWPEVKAKRARRAAAYRTAALAEKTKMMFEETKARH